MTYLLSLVIFLPFVGALALAIFVTSSGPIADQSSKITALFTSAATFLVSLVILFKFDPSNSGFQLVEEYEWLAGLNYRVGVDGISVLFVILTTGIMPLVFAASWNVKARVKEFMICFLVLETLMIGVFCSLDLIMFYVLFESGLIPMFIIIGVWGGDQKVYAAFKFFLYTLLGSILMLIAMLVIWFETGTTDIQKLLYFQFNYDTISFFNVPIVGGLQTLLWLAFFASFAVKIPMWPFHTWLPDAHVQAPTAGSIILAGILLKMGGYGFLRFSLPLFPEGSIFYQPLIFFLSCVAIIYTSLVAFAQQDIKKLIAYSSVAHMGFVTIGIFCFNTQGLDGAVFQMISHGLISGALFLAIGVIYERTHTRDINMLGDFATTMPKYSVFLMVFTLGSVGLPGTSGFIGEVLVLLGSWKVNPLVAMISGFSLILGAIYMLRFYKKVSFGVSENKEKYEIFDTNIREILTFIPLAILILLLGFFPNIVLIFLKVPHFLILESFK